MNTERKAVARATRRLRLLIDRNARPRRIKRARNVLASREMAESRRLAVQAQ